MSTLHIAYCTFYFKLYSKLCLFKLFNIYKISLFSFVLSASILEKRNKRNRNSKFNCKNIFELIFDKIVYSIKLLYNENNGFDKLLFKNILKMKGYIYAKFLL